MKAALVAIVIVLSMLVILLGAAVVRLENYRYASSIGICAELTNSDPVQRLKHETCLDQSQTRTHWFWHVLYGVKVL
jgi:hypothetical protein